MKDIPYKIGDGMKCIANGLGSTIGSTYIITRFTTGQYEGTRNWWYITDDGCEDWWTEFSDTTKASFIHVPKYTIIKGFKEFVRSNP